MTDYVYTVEQLYQLGKPQFSLNLLISKIGYKLPVCTSTGKHLLICFCKFTGITLMFVLQKGKLQVNQWFTRL